MNAIVFGGFGLLVIMLIITQWYKSRKSRAQEIKKVDWEHAYNNEQITKWFIKKKAESPDLLSFVRYMSSAYPEDIVIKHLTLEFMVSRNASRKSDAEYGHCLSSAKFLFLRASMPNSLENSEINLHSEPHNLTLLATVAAM